MMAVSPLATACAPPSGTPTATAEPTAGALQTQAAHDAAALAVADLSQRIAVDPVSIQVAGIQPHTWPDSSLDLPEPGQTTTPGPVSGHIVTLQYVRQTFFYHVADGIVRLDVKNSAPVPAGTPF